MTRANVVKWAALAAVGVVCVLVLAWLPGMAVGQGDRPAGGVPGGQVAALVTPVPVPGGPNFYSVSAMGFKPLEQDTGWGYYADSWLTNPGPDEATYVAALALPHGATVTKFVVFFYDNGLALDVQASLLKCSYWDGYCTRMAEVASSGTDTGSRAVEDSTIVDPVVDNQSNWYVAQVLLPPAPLGYEFALEAIRVDYGYGAALPIVMDGR